MYSCCNGLQQSVFSVNADFNQVALLRAGSANNSALAKFRKCTEQHVYRCEQGAEQTSPAFPL